MSKFATECYEFLRITEPKGYAIDYVVAKFIDEIMNRYKLIWDSIPDDCKTAEVPFFKIIQDLNEEWSEFTELANKLPNLPLPGGAFHLAGFYAALEVTQPDLFSLYKKNIINKTFENKKN
jgi:hypothetical protein